MVSLLEGFAGVALGAVLAGEGLPAVPAPGTSSFCPGRIREPPRLSRFLSTIARIVVRWAIERCHRVSPGRTVTVFQELEATGATAAWAGSASAATSAKGMGWSPFLEPELSSSWRGGPFGRVRSDLAGERSGSCGHRERCGACDDSA